MTVVRLLTALCLLFGLACVSWSAAPPPHLNYDKLIEDLGSDDNDVWQAARDKLWAAGPRSLPALRAAKKSADPDIVLRATVLLSKIEWGIYPDTPAEVVKHVEGYREAGEESQKRTHIAELTKLGRPGLFALRKVLTMESNPERKRDNAEQLKSLVRPQARGFIAKGDLDDADLALETAAAGSDEAALDYCAFLLLTGRAKNKLVEAEVRARAEKDKPSARLAALLRRGMGDLAGAMKIAEKADDANFLGHFLEETEDFKTLAKAPSKELKESPEALASLYYRAGDKDEYEKEMKKIPQGEHNILASAQFFTGQPKKAIETYGKTQDLIGTVRLLAAHGRRKEALELKAPKDDKTGLSATLELEQALLAHQMGDAEASKKLIESAMKAITAKVEEDAKQNSFNDYPLGLRLQVAKKVGKFDEAIDEVAALLDKGKSGSPPSSVLAELGGPADRDALALVWQFLRETKKDTVQSEHLKLVRDWFTNHKTDKDFDDTIAAMKKWEGAGKERQAEWELALARLYLAVGKAKDAEGIYKNQTEKETKTPADFQRLGDYYFAGKRWDDAAEAYAGALKIDPTLPAATYFRGLALIKADKSKEGKALVERGHLLPLAEEQLRHSLADLLNRAGFADEAAAEQVMLVRVSPFRSVYASNASTALGTKAAQKRDYADAARLFRQMIVNVTLGRSGEFNDKRAYLVVPGRAHQYEALAQIKAGKLEAALAEAKKAWEYLPEETTVAAELVRALEKAEKKEDADKVFDEVYKRLEKGAEEAPKMGEAHNRLAWLTARTGRNLKQGLAAAKKATELSPKSAVVYDTLAEVHFQNGDKDEAVEAIKKAVELSKSPYYAAQQKRIEAGDKKAELPPR
jgi:tetratricopeptide (TPR) repeat protein